MKVDESDVLKYKEKGYAIVFGSEHMSSLVYKCMHTHGKPNGLSFLDLHQESIVLDYAKQYHSMFEQKH